MTASHSSGVILTRVRSRRMPALLTSASSRPSCSTAVRTIACAASISEQSPTDRTAVPPAATISSTTAWPAASSTSPTTTPAPSRASSSASPRPRPRPAPVTIATLPSRSPMPANLVGPVGQPAAGCAVGCGGACGVRCNGVTAARPGAGRPCRVEPPARTLPMTPPALPSATLDRRPSAAGRDLLVAPSPALPEPSGPSLLADQLAAACARAGTRCPCCAAPCRTTAATAS